jgi:hypothetical protein
VPREKANETVGLGCGIVVDALDSSEWVAPHPRQQLHARLAGWQADHAFATEALDRGIHDGGGGVQ